MNAPRLLEIASGKSHRLNFRIALNNISNQRESQENQFAARTTQKLCLSLVRLIYAPRIQ
jgi:hypothetical protein